MLEKPRESEGKERGERDKCLSPAPYLCVHMAPAHVYQK
jgi:hypothetical protein